MILYNIPGRTALRIEDDTLLDSRATEHRRGEGLDRRLPGLSRLIARAPDGFEVYSGDDWAAFGYACLGAVGVVSVASHLVGARSTRCST